MIIVNFIKIEVVFSKSKTFYFTYPLPKHDFSHILPSCLSFIAESREYHPSVALSYNHKWIKNISTKFRQLLKQCSVFFLRICVLQYFVKFGAMTVSDPTSYPGFYLHSRCSPAAKKPWSRLVTCFPKCGK